MAHRVPLLLILLTATSAQIAGTTTTSSSSSSSSSTAAELERSSTSMTKKFRDVINSIDAEADLHSAVQLGTACERMIAIVGSDPTGRWGIRPHTKKRVFRLLQHELERVLLWNHEREEQDAADATGACESCLHALAGLSGGLHRRDEAKKGKLAKETARLIMDAGLLSVVMDILARYPAELTIQEHGLGVVAQLALQDDAQARERITTKFNGLAITAAALRRFPGASAVQKHGVAVLHYLGSSYLPARHLIASEGLMPLVVAAMELHPEIAAVQEAGTWLMMAMGVHNPAGESADDEMTQKELILVSRGLEAVLNAMRTHPTDSAVQFGALASLQSLIGPQVGKPPQVHPLGVPFESPFDAHTREELVAGGGIELIINAMNDHAADVGVHHVSCGVLETLIAPPLPEGHQPSKTRAFKAGVAKAIVRSLRTNGGSENVVIQCVGTIAELIGPVDKSDRFIARDFLRQGVARELTRVGEQHPHHAAVQGNICLAFLHVFYGGDDRHKALLGKEPAFLACKVHNPGMPIGGFGFIWEGYWNLIAVACCTVLVDKAYVRCMSRG